MITSDYWRERRKKALAAGMCPRHIDTRVIEGTKSCEKCIKYNNERNEKLRSDRKCLSHVKKQAVIGSDYCQECLDNYSKRCAERTTENIKNGYCPKHPNELAREGLITCNKCYIYNQKRIESCALEKVCPAHPSMPVIEGNKYCEKCIERDKLKHIKNRQRSEDNNLCTRCYKQPFKINSTCEDCWFKYMAWKHLDNADLAPNLSDKLYKDQKQKCVYSDVILIPGSENLSSCASIDHIIPEKKNGQRTLDNVQWTSFILNRMKGNETHKDFVKIMSAILTRFEATEQPINLFYENMQNALPDLVSDLCRKCHKNQSEINTTCKNCWFKIKASTHLGNASLASAIKDLFYIQQKEICIYSGAKLIPGSKNFDFCASLDHIIPLEKGGDNTLKNVQWISYKLNTMKSDLSHDEFIQVCSKIWKKFGNACILKDKYGN